MVVVWCTCRWDSVLACMIILWKQFFSRSQEITYKMLLLSAAWFTSVSATAGDSLFWWESISIRMSQEVSSALFVLRLASVTCSRAAARLKASAEISRKIHSGYCGWESVPRLFWTVLDWRRHQFVDRCDLDMSTETASSTEWKRRDLYGNLCFYWEMNEKL